MEILRRPGLRAHALMTLATLLLASAAIVFVLSHNQLVHSYGCIACIAAVGLARMAKGQPSINLLNRPATARPSRGMWAIGFALGLLWIASYVALREDASHGARVAWPVYLFAIVAIICASFWGYLLAANI